MPYADTQYDKYLQTVQKAFSDLNLGPTVRGIHESDDPIQEVKKAQAIFIGGGNTFLLLKRLYEYNLVPFIKERVLIVNFDTIFLES